ncbi:MAG: RNA polymerase sigma factor [Clostridiales Family XIII bacterium]|jgi:RNA polymerase sigma-70 factor (ECF subfamily)|nr:RNA polymerase sigma factor [Clostridiales Family XIII bacterium]
MENNRERFDEIYEAYAVETKRFIFTISRRNPEYTDDIFQNTWMNVYRYISTLRDEASTRAWLYSIARNESKRYFADKHIRFFDNVLPLTGPTGSAETWAIDPEDETASDFPDKLADSELLGALLRKLTAEKQQLILLYYYHELSLAEIAEALDANYNTVKSSFRRAIAELKEMAAEDGELS